jgi:predicted RNase H-like nuclease (RuvC/YqgF family)
MLETMNLNSIVELTSAIYAAIAAIIGGTVVKFLNSVSEGGKSALETHLLLRKELREELDTVKEEIQRLQIELDEWKQKYYNQVEITNELKLAIIKLNDELVDHKRAHQELINSYNAGIE